MLFTFLSLFLNKSRQSTGPVLSSRAPWPGILFQKSLITLGSCLVLGLKGDCGVGSDLKGDCQGLVVGRKTGSLYGFPAYPPYGFARARFLKPNSSTPLTGFPPTYP